MKTYLLLASILALGAGCATTGNGLPGRDGKTPSGMPDIEPHDGKDDVSRAHLSRVSPPELDGADRLYRRIETERAGLASTQVRFCVTPAGSVETVDVIASSGLPEYDRTVVDAVSTWQYAAYAAPAETRVCENLTVAYHAP
jgi:TonB family protein